MSPIIPDPWLDFLIFFSVVSLFSLCLLLSSSIFRNLSLLSHSLKFLLYSSSLLIFCISYLSWFSSPPWGIALRPEIINFYRNIFKEIYFSVEKNNFSNSIKFGGEISYFVLRNKSESKLSQIFTYWPLVLCKHPHL